MLSPFYLWPWRRIATPSTLRQVAAAAVVAASLAAYLAAFVPDLLVAYRYAGPSPFTEADRRQMAAVTGAIPADASVLVLGTASGVWHARLWQRGLYPKHAVVVMLEPFDAAAIRAVRKRFDIRYAVLIGPPRFDPGLRWSRDLGTAAGVPDRISFGELTP